MLPRHKQTTWAAIADGAKALILVNDGTDAEPVLTVLAKAEMENAPTREQGTDRPGRRADPSAGQRSAMETTDWHEFAEGRFVRDFAERLNRAAAHGRFDRLILVAPPKALGLLRPALSAEVTGRLAAEIPSDLTGHPVGEIERQIAKALGERKGRP